MLPGPVSAEGSAALPRPTAFDTLMAWLAEYIPTWGTSITLHVAVALLACFLFSQGPTPPPAFGYIGTFEPARPPPKIQTRQVDKPGEDQLRSRGKMILRPSSFLPQPTNNKIPGIGDLKTDKFIGILGIAGDRQIGGPEGLDSLGGLRIFSRVWGMDGQPETGNVVYVVDRSGSMTDSLEIVKAELR
jgi:hypothetical protein